MKITLTELRKIIKNIILKENKLLMEVPLIAH